ncbi:hypothetical protein C4K25_1250 [Pseudomonas chlororaphis]|nr:hypothetical protein C4K25_1250 [Pseudomonas chlororaphis]
MIQLRIYFQYDFVHDQPPCPTCHYLRDNPDLCILPFDAKLSC